MFYFISLFIIIQTKHVFFLINRGYLIFFFFNKLYFIFLLIILFWINILNLYFLKKYKFYYSIDYILKKNIINVLLF